MKEVKCPEEFVAQTGASMFIAGGISNCPLWQKELIALLNETDLVLLNPRRDNYDMNDAALEEDQIKWEHRHLQIATAYAFWFPCETVCPITLFELGKVAAGTKKRIFVGTHPDYSRKRDIRWQMLLQRPEIDVVHSLEDLADQIKEGWGPAMSFTCKSPAIPS